MKEIKIIWKYIILRYKVNFYEEKTGDYEGI